MSQRTIEFSTEVLGAPALIECEIDYDGPSDWDVLSCRLIAILPWSIEANRNPRFRPNFSAVKGIDIPLDPIDVLDEHEVQIADALMELDQVEREMAAEFQREIVQERDWA